MSDDDSGPFATETKGYKTQLLDALEGMSEDDAARLMLAAAGESGKGTPQNSPAGRAHRNPPAMTDGGTQSAQSSGANQQHPMANQIDWGELMGGGHAGGNWRNNRLAAGRAGTQFGGERDLYDTFGYDDDVSEKQLKQAYRRDDIAARIVDIYPNTTWREQPDITDDARDESAEDDELTDFETDVNRLFDEKRLLKKLKDADRLEGLGFYSALVYGLHDDADLIEPVETGALKGSGDYSGPDGIAHLTPVGPDRIDTVFIGDDPNDESYGKPVGYRIDFGPQDAEGDIVPISKAGGGDALDSDPDREGHPNTDSGYMKYVHADRVLHLAEDAKDNPLKSDPVLLNIWNRLNDVWKVVGSAAELFYRGADYGLHLNTEGPVENEGELLNEIMDYLHGLQPYIKTENMDVERLGGENVDPESPFNVLLHLISGATGIPKRILTGSERGELASTQDRATFFGRVSERIQQYAEPDILREFLSDMIRIGACAAPDGSDSLNDPGPYTVSWANLFELNQLEKADMASKYSSAVLNFSKALMSTDSLVSAAEIREFMLDMNPEVGSEASIQPGGGDGDSGGDEDQPEPEPGPGETPGDSGDEGADGLPELDEGDPEVQNLFDEISGSQPPIETDGGTDIDSDGGDEKASDSPLSFDEFNAAQDTRDDSTETGGFVFGATTN